MLSFFLLLGGRGILNRFLNVLDGPEDIFESRLVDNGLHMANDIGELCAKGGVDGEGDKGMDNRSETNISKSDAFRCEVRSY